VVEVGIGNALYLNPEVLRATWTVVHKRAKLLVSSLRSQNRTTCSRPARKVVLRHHAQNANVGSRRYVRKSSVMDGNAGYQSRPKVPISTNHVTQCSREWPCNHCQARKVPHICQFGPKKPQTSSSDCSSRYAEFLTKRYLVLQCSNMGVD
jgi:hypothetical protein